MRALYAAARRPRFDADDIIAAAIRDIHTITLVAAYVCCWLLYRDAIDTLPLMFAYAAMLRC